MLDGKKDEAVALLEEATVSKPNDATLWSDLAAVYLHRSQLTHDQQDAFLAVRAAKKSLAIDQSLPSAYFNYALSLEGLFLYRQAGHAWRKYLAIDPASSWATEARSHLKRISERQNINLQQQYIALLSAIMRGDVVRTLKLVESAKLNARRLGEEEILPAWGELWLDRNSEALKKLSIAQSLGVALAACCRDPLVLDAVKAIDVATGGINNLDAHARGLLAYRAGVQSYQEYKIGKARLQFEEASNLLHGAGNPIAHWADFFLAACSYQLYDYSGANSILRSIIMKKEVESYYSLLARCLWLRGLMEFVASRFGSAMDNYAKSRLLFREAREFENVAAIDHLIFEVYYMLGDKRQAWNSIWSALSVADNLSDERRRQAIMEGAAILALEEGEPGIAVLFQDEAVLSAVRSLHPAAIAATLAWRALIHKREGVLSAAEEDILKAGKYAESIADPVVRAGTIGDVLVLEGEILREQSPSRAFKSLRKAVNLFKRTQYHAGLLKAYLELARASMGIGDDRLAESYLSLGIREIEMQRSNVEGELQVSFFDNAREIFDEMVRLQLDYRSRPERALEYTEQARGRSLLDRYSPMKQGLSVPNWSTLPAKTAFVEFLVLDQKIIIWSVSSQGIRLFQRTFSREELEEVVEQLRTSLLGRQRGVVHAHLSRLYDVLLSGVVEEFSVDTTVVLVPDRCLNRIPFTALVESRSGKYLIEKFRIEIAPSIGFYLAVRKKSLGTRCIGCDTILVVGDPDIDAKRFYRLPRIPFAQAEVREIAQIFPGSHVLTGQDANKLSLKDRIDKFGFIHLGVHVVSNERRPPLSHLVLASSGSGFDDSVLYAREIVDWNLAGSKVVFLAGCDTYAGSLSSTEGAFSLARSFLLAGTSSVIATLWQANDRGTAELVVGFYRSLKAGRMAGDALRDAQLMMLKHPVLEFREPRIWAAFELAGSGETSFN